MRVTNLFAAAATVVLLGTPLALAQSSAFTPPWMLGDELAVQCYTLDRQPIAQPAGLRMRWDAALPATLLQTTQVDANYSVTIDDSIFWGDAANAALLGTEAAQWQRLCNASATVANTGCTAGATARSTCCVWHANLHSCRQSTGSTCEPWITPQNASVVAGCNADDAARVLVTHTSAQVGVPGAYSQGLQLPIGSWVTIAHVKIMNFQCAVGALRRSIVPPPVAGKEELPVGAYIAIGLVSAALVAGIAAVSVKAILARMALARCPLDAAQPFTVAFVSVANEDAVRAQHPDDAPKAFARLAAIVRREAGRHGCHEARRVDEVTVMLVAKRAEDAARCGAAIVAAAVEEPWEQHLPVRHDAHLRDDQRSLSRRSRQSRLTSRSKLSATASQRTRQSSTSRSKVAPEGVVPPLVNVGVHTGLGAIEHDAATGALSYHGAVVAAAAHVADAGAGDHVVLSEACVDAVADVAALDGAVQELQRLSVKAAGGVALDCGLFSLVPEADAAYEAALQARIDAQARLRARGDADGGAIVAALSQAESGFARRRVAVVCAFVPGLADAAGRAMGEAEQAQAVQQALDEIADVAGRSRGRVAGVVDGRVFVTVNGSGAQVSQPDARAALIAHQLAFELPRASRRLRGISCGVASSRALVGASRDAPAMLGTARTFARVAQQAAARLRVPALAVDTGYDDVASTMQVVTVDAVALPLGPRADAAHRITRLVQLIEPLDNTADGEWLYNVGGAAQGTNGGEAAGDAAAQEQEWAKHAADASRDMAAATAAAASGVPAAPTPTVPITGGGSNPQSPDAEPLVLAEDAVRIAARRLAAAKEAPSFTAYCMQRSAELRIAF